MRSIAEPWFYLAPALLWFLIFSVFPLVYTVNMSLRDWSSADHPFVGLSHYVEMIGDQSFYHSLRVTAIFAGIDDQPVVCVRVCHRRPACQ